MTTKHAPPSSSSSSSTPPSSESFQPISITRAEKLWNDVFAGIVREKGLSPEEAKFVLGAASGMWRTKVSRACVASGVATPEDPAAKATEASALEEERKIAELAQELSALRKQAEHYRQGVPAALRKRLGQCRDRNIEDLERRVGEFEGRVPESPEAAVGGAGALPVQTTELLKDTERRMGVAAKRFREAQLALNSLSKRTDRLTNVVGNLAPKGGVKRRNASAAAAGDPGKDVPNKKRKRD